MTVLIGFMGFYVLYPLTLIVVNSFNTATIAEPEVYGLGAWRASFQRARDMALALEQREDRHRAANDRPADREFHLVVAGAHEYLLRQRL